MSDQPPNVQESGESFLRRMERRIEAILFGSRWLALPIYFGFVITIGFLVLKFFDEIYRILPDVLTMSARSLIVEVLRLVDLSLAVNLVVIVMLAGYENFISKIASKGHEDWPEWLDHIDFSALKIKLIGTVVVISAVDLLERFMDIEHQSRDILLMLGGLEILLVVVGLLLVVMDRLARSGP